MAIIIPYIVKGKHVLKQLGLTSPASELDKPRIWVDFNELVDFNTYLLSRVDYIGDSNGDTVELFDGLHISVFDIDLGEDGRPDNLLAEGVVIRNTSTLYCEVKWLVKLITNEHHGNEVYWLSDL